MSGLFGIAPRDLVGLVRGARADADPAGVIALTGPRAAELADALAHDGERSLIRVTTDTAGAAALVVCADGQASAPDEAAMRRATRAGVPVVAVQLGDPSTRLAYALPGETVVATPGAPLPVHAIAGALAAVLRGDGAALAGRLPVLREPVARRRVREAALSTAALAGLSRGHGPMLPVLTLAQARMLRQLAIGRGGATPADPRGLATSLGPELGAALAAGLACRAVARRLPLRGRVTDAVVALTGTAALAAAADRLRSTG
jgi:hypothetical protein